MEDGCISYIDNSFTAAIKGKDTIDLEFTFEKLLTLRDVYHVP